jgi:hypothetical protein
VTLRELDPERDDRWAEFVERADESSVFHTREWARALRRTYGFQSLVYTTADEGKALENGLLFARVNSWLTGRRLVSLPFSDHCAILAADPSVARWMLESIRTSVPGSVRYIELRPTREMALPDGYVASNRFAWHSIDLGRSLEQILSGLHKSQTQRAIRRAERCGIVIEAGRVKPLLDAFYRLHTLTRHRHGVPVQPYEWFRRLAEAFGDRLRIYVARYRSLFIAAILVIQHKTTLVYKYGCLDMAYKRLGAMPALFWRAIEDGVRAGCLAFDLGRSDMDAPGLIAFKEHLGAARQSLVYYRYPDSGTQAAGRSWTPMFPRGRASRLVVRRLARTRCATRLYKHFA